MNNPFFIALVICTYNRDKYLPQALESISRQSFDRNRFQLLVIDNNSTDETAVISKKFIANNLSLNAQYFFESNKGLSFARNRGLNEAHADIICYVDDDAILSVDYVKEVVNFFQQHSAAVGAGGKVIPKYESGEAPAWMNKYLNGFIGRVAHGEQIKKFDAKMKYPAGCNMIYKKNALQKAGGFNNELTFRSDDKYIFYKVKEVADEIYYLPDAFVEHYIDSRRLEFDNFRKLFLKTGNEEKIRVRHEKGFLGVVKKLIEFKVKFLASLIIYLQFLLKGQEIKGRYTMYAQWFTLIGFLRKNIFVR